MVVKRKHDLECEEMIHQVESLKLKAANSGKDVSAIGRTQMMLTFGQHLQASKAKAARQAMNQVDPQQIVTCSHCNKHYGLADIRSCIHCGKYQCVGCTQQCYCCKNQFCAQCSIYDYSEFETRSVCFDCNR
ncbi:hypothetical protein LPJ73_004942 [Coemansia sp. RSA 2703]|nr:hypothetical protein LPJ73_004942 [Coemansia sp. RSA 2703]